MSDKICPNCNKPLDEHYVAKSATLNRPHVYICPTNVCPVDGLFEEVPAAPAQPAGELREAAIELDRILCQHSEITDNNVVYWFGRYLPEMDSAVQKLRAALQRERGVKG